MGVRRRIRRARRFTRPRYRPDVSQPAKLRSEFRLQMVFDFAKKKAGLVIGDRVVIIQKLSGTAIVKVQELT